LLPFAAWKNGPSAAALTIPGVGWGLPGPGEPTGHHRGLPIAVRVLIADAARDGCGAVLLLSLITRLIGRGDTTRSRRSKQPPVPR